MRSEHDARGTERSVCSRTTTLLEWPKAEDVILARRERTDGGRISSSRRGISSSRRDCVGEKLDVESTYSKYSTCCSFDHGTNRPPVGSPHAAKTAHVKGACPNRPSKIARLAGFPALCSDCSLELARARSEHACPPPASVAPTVDVSSASLGLLLLAQHMLCLHSPCSYI